MRTLNDLKKAMRKDEKLKKQFISLKSKEEAVALAQDMGYKISLEEIEKDEEINEELLESVAGGSRKYDIEAIGVKVGDIAQGEKSEVVDGIDINKRLEFFRKKEEEYRR